MQGVKAAPLTPDGNEPLPEKTKSSILWSSGNAWDGIVVERYSFNETSAQNCKIIVHGLVVCLSPPITETGGVCVFPAGTFKQICPHQQADVLVIRLSPEILHRTVADAQGLPKPELTEQHQLCDTQIEHIGLALKAEAEAGYLSGRLYGESLCAALSIHLLTKYSAVKPVISEYKGGMTPHSLRRVAKYIQDNLAEDMRLNELADVAGLSQHRFAHNFKHTTGLAPHQYVIRERIERAKQLLRETDMTVTAIAYAVGCGSPSRFTLLFRRATGLTPSAYRISFR